MPEVSDSTGVAVRCRLVAPATARRIAPVGAKRHYQSVDVSGDVYHSKPLQFDRCLDQTPNEHEFPLGYLGGVETPKYLMELMLFNSKSRSTCTDFCEEPKYKPNKKHEGISEPTGMNGTASWTMGSIIGGGPEGFGFRDPGSGAG